jgi:hypothetical protein
MENKQILSVDHYAQYQIGTPEYIVALAQFQRSHNHPLKLSFRGKTDQEAFELASKVLELENISNVDALALAEDITGVSYKEGPTALNPTTHLGIEFLGEISKRKRELAKITDDTGFSNDLDNYIRIVKDEGFEKVLEIPFQKIDEWNSKITTRNEKFFIFFNKEDGILLSFDTYNGNGINGGHFYYNIIPKTEDFYKYISSGGGEKINGTSVYVGDHDCRENFRLKVNRLRQNGTFLFKWLAVPHIWLIHHGETSSSHDINCDYKQLTNQKLLQLPEYVLEAITPTLDNIFAYAPENEVRTKIQQDLFDHLKKNGKVSKLVVVEPKSEIETTITDFHILEYWQEHCSIGKDYCRGRALLIEGKSKSGIIVSSKTDQTITQTAEFSIRDVKSFE